MRIFASRNVFIGRQLALALRLLKYRRVFLCQMCGFHRGSPLLLLRYAIIRGYGERKSVHGAQAKGGEGGGEGKPDSAVGCCIPESALMHGLGYVNSPGDPTNNAPRVKCPLAVSVISNNGALPRCDRGKCNSSAASSTFCFSSSSSPVAKSDSNSECHDAT